LRNTDLLQGDEVELEKSNKKFMEKINIKFIMIPAIIASAILFLALLEFPYGYYTLLRIVVTIISIYYAYWIYETIKEQKFWFWGLVVITILFNPIFPIHLTKSIWSVMDIVAGLFFISLIIRYRKHRNMNTNEKNKGFISLFVIAIISLIAVSTVTTGAVLYKKGIFKSTASISESTTKKSEPMENTEVIEAEETESVANLEELNKIEEEAEKIRQEAERSRQEAEKNKKEQEQLESEQETKRLEAEAKKIAEQNRIKEQKEKEEIEKLLLEQGKQMAEQRERERQQGIAREYKIAYEKRSEERKLAEKLENQKNEKELVIGQITNFLNEVSDELNIAYDKVQEQGEKIKTARESGSRGGMTTAYWNSYMNVEGLIYNNLINKHNSLLDVKNKISTILFEVEDYYKHGTIVPASSRSYLSSLGIYL
ncbi:hypothetical protein KKC65_02895, partial [Patescibacteria group bacterium]|nr:hypothetical protein [Patescibacteria group bacterium]